MAGRIIAGDLSIVETTSESTAASNGVDVRYLAVGAGGEVVIDSAELMFKGDYARSGPDLVITGADGRKVVVVDFFAGATPPNLMSADGALLTGDVVARLAGPRFPGQFAQAAPGAAATAVGQVETVNGPVAIRRADGTIVQVQAGTAVFEGDVVETGAAAAVNIVFVDRTILTLTESARMVIDRYVYNPAGTGNSSLLNLVQGTFVFVAGQIAPTGDMRIETPVASMGIRGTTGEIVVAANNGATTYTLVPDPNGSIGRFDVFNKTTGQLLFSATQANQSILVSSAAGDFQQTIKLPDQILTQQQVVALAFQTFNTVQTRVQAGQPVVNPTNTGTPVQPGQPGQPGVPVPVAPTPQQQVPQQQQQTPTDQQQQQQQQQTPSDPQQRGDVPAGDGGTQTAGTGDLPGLGTGGTDTGLVDNSSSTGGTGAGTGTADNTAGTNVDLLGNTNTDGSAGGDTGGGGSDPPPPPPQNTPPTVSLSNAVPQVNEDGSVTISGFTVSDPNGGTITTTINAQSTVTLASTAGLTFTVGDGVDDEVMVFTGSPEAIQAALNGLTYTASPNNDQSGGISITLNDGQATVTANFTVPIVASPDDPVAGDDSFVIQEDGTSSSTLRGNDSDPDTGETAQLVVSAVNGSPTSVGVPITLASGATLTVLSNGNFTIDPVETLGANDFVVDQITYTVQDPTGRTDSATATFTIFGANDAPVAADDPSGFVTAFNTPVTIAPAALTANDTDIDGDTLAVTAVGNAVNGTVQLFEGLITFTPNTGFTGTATFEYTVADGNGGSDIGLVSVVVTANDPPVAVADTYAATEDTTLNVNAASGVLGNDSDPDSDPITAQLVSNVAHGSLTLNADGSFSYTPDGNFNGTDSFTYRANDGVQNSNTVTVTINVGAVNDPPTTAPITASVSEDAVSPLNVDLIAGPPAQTDVDLPPQTLTASGVPTSITTAGGRTLHQGTHYTVSGASFVLTVAGLALFNSLAAAASDQVVVNYQVSDGVAQPPNTLTITVNGANDAPVVANPIADQAVAVNGSLNFQVPANAFADPDAGANLTYSATLDGGGALPGWLSFNAATRTFTGTPGVDDRGTISIRVTASDGSLSASDVFDLTIGPNVIGDANPNTLNGTALGDYIVGLGGNDTIAPGAGDDLVDGGADTDTVDYSSDTAGVDVDLAEGIANGTAIGNDDLISIESARGGSGHDVLAGDAGANRLEGNGGNDTLDGLGGIDTLIGGAGDDLFSVGNGDIVDGGADTDQVQADTSTNATGFNFAIAGTNVEIVGGRDGNDTIDGTGVGSAIALDIVGFGGNDSLTGGDGDDVITGDEFTNTNAGNDTIFGGEGFDQIFGNAGDDVLVGGGATSFPLGDRLDGGAGNDQLTGSGNGFLFGGADNDTILGGDDDQLFGNEGADDMSGDTGTQFFQGGSGNDTMDGGADVDWVDYGDAAGPGGLTIDLNLPTVTDSFGNTDTLIEIENVLGTNFADTIIGDAFDNALFGRAGNDVVRGGAGNDTLVGGADIDTVDYSTATTSVTVNLSASSAFGDASVGIDQVSEFEDVIGGSGADTLTGNSVGNSIFGGLGNDTLAGLEGDDVLAGGSDTDTVDYTLATAAVAIDLAAGTASGAGTGTDTLISIERATGSVHNDTIAGTAGDNILAGGGGADSISGGTGINVLIGGAGNDTLVGGTGTDVRTETDIADYSGASEGIVVTLSGAFGTSLSTVVGGASTGSDTLRQVEQVRGSAQADTYTADTTFTSKFLSDDLSQSSFNEFRGGGGNDTVTGNGATRVDYRDADGAVTVNLATGVGQGSVVGGATNIGVDTFTLANLAGGANGVAQVEGSDFADTLIGSNGTWFEQFRGNAGNDTIDGGGGIEDQADYRNSPGAVVVNLTTGVASDGWGGTDTLINIERARGSEFDDHITGSSVDNNLFGRDGNDTLIGGAGGFDIFVGGRGDDLLVGTAVLPNPALDGSRATYTEAEITGAITVTLGTASGPTTAFGTVVGDASVGTDTLQNIEQVFGTRFADTFVAHANFDGGTFSAFHGGAGNDTITGNGQTRVSYRDALAGVTVDLDPDLDGIGTDGFGESAVGEDAANVGVDDFEGGINSVEGSEFGDEIFGSNATTFESFRGRGGNDTIDGRGGNADEADYRNATSGITVVMDATAGVKDVTNDGFFGGQDELINIERIRGSFHADSITMDGNANRVRAEAGYDTVFGGAGNDTLEGGDGDDNLQGQADNDSLNGGDGFDFLAPGGGSDVVNGTPVVSEDESYDDRDTVSYHDTGGTVGVIVNLSAASITATIAAGTFTVGATSARDYAGFTDTLIDIERARGTNNADFFRGADTEANMRQEIFQGLGGNDTMNGGDGRNIAGYDRDANHGGGAGVIVNLSSATINVDIGAGLTAVGADQAKDGFGSFDTLINIFGARGTGQTDYFLGDAGRNYFRMLGGNDTVHGGDTVGPDGFTENGDQDVADFYIGDIFTGPGATVDLGAGTATSATGGTITLASIEDAFGTFSSDNITGSFDHNLLDGQAGDDTLTGLGGEDILIGGAGSNLLDGGADEDAAGYLYDPAEYRYLNSISPGLLPATMGGVTVNLATGIALNWAGGTDTLIGIENVGGTFFNDTLTGDANANGFAGFAGNDTIDGGAGSDWIFYGIWDFDGRNIITISGINGSVPDGVVVNLGTGVASDGEGGTDTLTSIENVHGSFGADSITGNGSDNIILGGQGADTMHAAGGIDTLSYEDGNLDSGVGVNVNLANNLVSGGDANGDVISGFENVIGTEWADTITGDGGNNLIEGGGSGDSLTGGGGNDTVSYESSFFGVTVNLFNATGHTGGHAHNDTLSGFANVIGSDGANDVIFGNGSANRLEGLAGDDSLHGDAGADTLIGGLGNDNLVDSDGAGSADGGVGQDTLQFLFDTGNHVFDLRGLGGTNFQGIERMFLNGGMSVDQITLKINQNDVINFSTDANTSFLANIGGLDHSATDNFVIGGITDDVVELHNAAGGGGAWASEGVISISGTSHTVYNYTSGATVLASVAVENDVFVNIV
jgi:VCBS repeat-containing protein